MYSKRYETPDGKVRYIKPKNCKECGSEFNPSKTTQTYCSYKCSNAVTNRKKSTKAAIQLSCLACKKSFTKRASDLRIYPGSLATKKYRYCSHQCWKNKTQTVSSLKKKAWLLFSLYIKNRDNWTCFTCGKYETGRNMHGGHFISRRYNATLFDERNVHAQCASCNMFRNGEPHIYAQKLSRLYGNDWLDQLIEDSKVVKKFTRQELLDLCKKYKITE